MRKTPESMSDEELKAAIRAGRERLAARIAAGEVVIRPLKYDKKGPSIKGGPHGWAPLPERP